MGFGKIEAGLYYFHQTTRQHLFGQDKHGVAFTYCHPHIFSTISVPELDIFQILQLPKSRFKIIYPL